MSVIMIMKTRRFLRGSWCSVLAVLLLSLCAAVSARALEAGDEAVDFEVQTLEGKVLSLSEYAGKLVVLEWTHYGCPFVGKLYKSGKIPELQREVTDQGVVWLVVASGYSANVEKLKSHEFAKLRKVDGVLLDTDGALAKAYGTRTSPHFFVIGSDSKIAFEGAPDDNRSPSVESALEGRNYLAEAIEAALVGKVPAVRSAKPYGCAVKYPDN